jgi:O-antigen ligase
MSPGREAPSSGARAGRETGFDRTLTYGVILSFQGYVFFTPFSIALSQTTLFLGVFIWLVRLARGTGVRPRRLGVEWPILVFLISSVISTLTARDPAGSFVNLKKFFLMGILYYTAYQWSVPRRFRLGILTLVVSSAATAVIALLAFGFFPQTGLAGRAVAPFSTSMTTGNVVMLLALVAGGQLLFGGHRGWFRVLVGLSFVSLVALLFMTFTRSSWLGFSLGAAILLGYRRRRLALLVPGILIALYLVGPSSFRERVNTIGDPDHYTNRQRIEMLRGSVGIVRDHPVLGVGLMDLADVYREYKPPEATAIHGHMHNIFLQVAASQGLLGLACFLFLLFGFLRLVVDAARSRQDLDPLHHGWVVSAVASFYAFVLSGMFDWTFGDSEVVMLFYLVLGGAGACVRSAERRRRLGFLRAHRGGRAQEESRPAP